MQHNCVGDKLITQINCCWVQIIALFKPGDKNQTGWSDQTDWDLYFESYSTISSFVLLFLGVTGSAVFNILQHKQLKRYFNY